MSKLSDPKYDIIKGISIYFVVCIHIFYKFFTPDWKPLAFELYNYLTGFAVPIFLILGGFFFGKKFLDKETPITAIELKRGLVNFFRRLVLPYYIFVLLLTLYNWSIGKNIFWKHFLFIDVKEHGLYFLIIYTYASVFAILMLWLLKNRSKMFISFMIPILSLIFFIITVHLRDIDSGVLSQQLPLISFFCFGIPLYFVINHFERKISSLTMVFLLGTVIIAYTAILYFARKIYGPFPVITSAPPTVYLLIYSLLAFWLSLSLLSNNFFVSLFKCFKFQLFGTKSMFIFLVHPYLIKGTVPMIKLGYRFVNSDYNNSLFIIPVLIIAYLITLLSSGVFEILPSNLKFLFTR